MDEKLVEILRYEEPGYQPLVWFEGWRVAILNYIPDEHRRQFVRYLERHRQTDEVFVLLSGECTLYIGGAGDTPEDIAPLPLERNKLYNVRKGVWHNLVGEPGMSLLIVENADTSMENSDHFPVTADMLPC